MAIYDTSVARGLQERYRAGEPRSLTLLYLELRRMAGLILKDLSAPTEKIDEYSHEAATGIVEHYLKNPMYHIGSFYDVVKHASLDAMNERSLNPSAGYRDRPKTRAHTAWIDLDQVRVAFNSSEEIPEDDPLVVDGLSNYFRHFSWYRPAIKGLMPYIPKRWLLDHAVQLKRIFLEARDGRGRLQGPTKRASKSKEQKGSARDNKQVQAYSGPASLSVGAGG